MTVIRMPEIEAAKPLDVMEQFVAANDWAFDRPNDHEMAVQVPGKWCDYNVYCAWNEAMGRCTSPSPSIRGCRKSVARPFTSSSR